MPLIQEIKVPLLSVNDTSLTIVDIIPQNGTEVNIGDVLMVFETSKTTYELHAEAKGFIKILAQSNHDYDVNTTIAEIYSTKEETIIPLMTEPGITQNDKELNVEQSAVKDKVIHFAGTAHFSQSALQLIKELDADISVFEGWDLVSSEDVKNRFYNPKSNSSANSPKNTTEKQPVQLPANTYTEQLSKNKLREIEFLSAVQETGLTSTIYISIETKNLFTHINPKLKYFKDSILPVTIYEVSRLLKKYKLLNSFYNRQQIHYYKQVNVGFAVDIDKGLKVVKIADTDLLNIAEIEHEIFVLSDKYLENKLAIEDLTDITFTITDLSNEGISFFKPLVNQFNSAILGISSVQKNGQQTLSLTFDHRVTEGKLASGFLKELKDNIESYAGNTDEIIRTDIYCYKCMKTIAEDISGLGFVACITNKGKDGYICSSCWSGH